MSEFQFYEFKSIDKPLSKKDRKEVSSWSSRTTASNTGAIFSYSYGSFPKNPIKVVENYFDALFHIANWGTVQLVFKFPTSLVDVKQMKQFCAEGLEIYEKGDYTLVDIWIEDDEGGGQWVEGEGCLSSLLPLRDDIIAGDYRCLYLIWLKVSTRDVLNDWGNVDAESLEPKVPSGLNSQNGALLDFADIFEIDKQAIAVAAENSSSGNAIPDEAYSRFITRLPNDEKDDFLLRLFQNEALLNVKLLKRLKDFLPQRDEVNQSCRTVGEIVQGIRNSKDKKKLQEKQERETERLAKLKKIEGQEPGLWTKVDSLIAAKNTKSYDEAVVILKELKELALHKKRLNDFCEKIKEIKDTYSRLSGLISRIDQAKLTHKN